MVTPLLLSLGVLSAPVTFTLRIPDGRTRFHTGEVIPIELAFTSTIPNRFILDTATYDRSGRLTIDEFRVDPIDRVTDPLLDYFASLGGYIGGGIRGNPVLGDAPTIVKLELNEWFRFDRPGTFRLSARTRRVTEDPGSGPSDVLVLESNTVTFDIVPSDAEWAAAAQASARRLLDSTASDVERREGCRILRFLATDAAVDEMIARFEDGRWGCQFDYITGLFGAPNRARVVREMEAALKRRDQAVSDSFLRTLAVLSLYVAHPEYRPAQTPDNKGRMPPSGELGRRRELVEDQIAIYRAALLAAMTGKHGAARAITLADQFDATRDDTLRHELIESFLELPTDRQLRLLQHSWSRLADPEMLPVLRQLVTNGPAVNQPYGDIALLRFYQLSPGEGRAAILKEIAAPRRGRTLKTLGVLPDRELPALDDRLAANVESAPGYEDLSIRAELLQRYATAGVAARVLASVRPRLNGLACRPKAALLAYFLRVDPGLGADLLNAALAERERTGCYQFVLLDIARLHRAPELEAAAIARVQDASPQVAGNAASMLERYGSPAAVAPLRAAFERWHAAWTGRAEDLRPRAMQPPDVGGQSVLESRLFNALAAGRGWLTGRRDIETLRAWCVSDGCHADANRMLDMIASGRLDVTVIDGDEASVQIAQYQFESISDLETKLAQYPAGTHFQLRVFTPSPAIELAVVERIRAAAGAHGVAIEPIVR
jgi:hypothetical protein